MIILSDKLFFPDVTMADEHGLLAIGGDLRVERLILAYKNGIFPWYSKDQPILWWSPNPRFVLFPENLKISKSMKNILKKDNFKVTYNRAFEEVVSICSEIPREGQKDTWITQEMLEAYIVLHKKGFAKSIEVWKEDELVGGLYGVDLNNGVFCGESMFARVSNASKVALIHLIQNNKYEIIDCQIHTKHLESLGAENISRDAFLKYLN